MLDCTNDKIAKVKQEAEKKKQERLEIMMENMANAEMRIEEQKKRQAETARLNKLQRETQIKFQTENVER